MKKLFLCLILISSPALADSPKQAFEGLMQCLKREPNSCAAYFTRDSQELYNKVTGYDLARCAPTHATYISDTPSKQARLMRVRIIENQSEYIARLAFLREGSIWKLSLPETLSRGMGPKWRNQVTATEQIYLMLKTQMNHNFGCETIKALVAQPKNNG